MTARSTDEPHRVSSELELFFDLTFVIAVTVLTGRFADALGDGRGGEELVPFLQVCFAIWWAWANFTWFASAFDTDDVPFRLMTAVQMAGVLVLAAGVPAAIDRGDYGAVTLGYLIMRVSLIGQWARVATEDPASRPTAVRWATGIAIAEVGWLLRLWLDDAGVLSGSLLLAAFAGLVVAELMIPRWAERRRPTCWHPHHIAERYGLFAIILLGDGVFAASTGVERAVAAGGVGVSLVGIGVAGLVLVFALWWIYFLPAAGEGLAAHRDRSYVWGYGHFGIFAALAAVGAGLRIAVEQTARDVAASPAALGYAVAIPVAVFLVLVWALHVPIAPASALRPAPVLAACAVVLLLPLASEALSVTAVVAAIAIACAAVVAVLTTSGNAMSTAGAPDNAERRPWRGGRPQDRPVAASVGRRRGLSDRPGGQDREGLRFRGAQSRQTTEGNSE